MAKPTEKPIIASSDVNLPNTGQPNKSQPATSLQTTGYDKGQKPAAEEFNWLWDNIHDWINHFETITDDSLLGANNLSDVSSASTAFNNIKQTATDSVTGVVELATLAEADGDTGGDRVVTSDVLNGYIKRPTSSLFSSGYYRDSNNGYTIQWGNKDWTTSAASNEAVTFPINFTTTYMVIANEYTTGGAGAGNNLAVSSTTVSGFNVWNPVGVSAGNGVSWIAVGIVA